MPDSVVEPRKCDGCDRVMAKAKRKYGGLSYCGTCYPKLFEKRVCSQCGDYARLPIFDLSATCTKCFNSGPCLRCKRTGRPVGRMTAKGPVCNACAQYVGQSGYCDVCAEFSIRLVNKNTYGQIRRCCTACGRTGYATCPSCHRYRKLAEGPDGVMQCKVCVEFGEINCLECNESMPAGYGSRCEACYWQKIFRKRVAIDTEGFSSAFYRQEFNAYGHWLFDQVSAKKAALLINKHMVFFVEMAERWSHLPTYDQLVQAFGAEWLRRAKYPVLWMASQRSLAVDDRLKQEATQQRRINSILVSARSKASTEILNGFYDFLTARVAERKSSLVSIRISLRSAANLLDRCDASKSAPSSKTLCDLLVSTPGNAASLACFISYLNKTRGVSVEFPEASKVRALRREKLEKELGALVVQARQGVKVMDRWPSVALDLFHGVSKRKKSRYTLIEEGDGFRVIAGEREYWIPSPLS